MSLPLALELCIPPKTYHIMRYFILLIGLLLVAGCAPSPTSSPSVDSTAITPKFKNNISTLFGNGGKKVKDNTGNYIAPNIIWKDSLGVSRSLDSTKGKIIIINFWATWCDPCIAEMPYLQSISDSLKSEVVVIGVTVDKESPVFDNVELFVTAKKLTFQIIIDNTAKVYFNYGAHDFIPWTFVVDRDGYIYHIFEGGIRSRKDLMDVLNQIL